MPWLDCGSFFARKLMSLWRSVCPCRKPISRVSKDDLAQVSAFFIFQKNFGNGRYSSTAVGDCCVSFRWKGVTFYYLRIGLQSSSLFSCWFTEAPKLGVYINRELTRLIRKNSLWHWAWHRRLRFFDFFSNISRWAYVAFIWNLVFQAI